MRKRKRVYCCCCCCFCWIVGIYNEKLNWHLKYMLRRRQKKSRKEGDIKGKTRVKIPKIYFRENLIRKKNVLWLSWRMKSRKKYKKMTTKKILNQNWHLKEVNVGQKEGEMKKTCQESEFKLAQLFVSNKLGRQKITGKY